jgi:hypothetical protein
MSCPSAALEYMEKSGSELSTKLYSPCDGDNRRFGSDTGWYWLRGPSTHTVYTLVSPSKRKTNQKHNTVIFPLEISETTLGH